MDSETYTQIIACERRTVEDGILIPMDYILKRFPAKVYQNESMDYIRRQVMIYIKMELAKLNVYMNGEIVY